MTSLKSTLASGQEFFFKMNEAAVQKAIQDSVKEIVHEIAHDVLETSQKLVPVDTGVLKKTGHVDGPYVFKNYVYEDVLYDAGYAAYVEYGRRSSGEVRKKAKQQLGEAIYGKRKDQKWYAKARSVFRQQLVASGYKGDQLKAMMSQWELQHSARIPRIAIDLAGVQNFPPPGAIYQWLIRKGHSPEEAAKLVYPVSKHIVEKGIKARRFLRKSVQQVMMMMRLKYSTDFNKYLKTRMMRGGIMQRGEP